MNVLRVVLAVALTLEVLGQNVQPFDVAGAGIDVACGIGTPVSIQVLQFLNISEEIFTDIVHLAPAGSGRVLALVNHEAPSSSCVPT